MNQRNGFWVFQATRVNELESRFVEGQTVLFSPTLLAGSFASGGVTKDGLLFVKYFDKGQECDPEAEFGRLAKLEGLNGCKWGSVPRVYALGEARGPITGQSVPAILMEVAKGEPLCKVVEASLLSGSVGEPPSTDKVIRFGLSLAYVYKELHEKGIVHRDASGNNVLVNTKSISLPVTLIDFGNSFENGLSTLTRTRVAAPYFGAPEVFSLADPFNRQGFEQDVWSIGALLFYMKTGAYPHADQIDALGPAPSLSDIANAKRAPLNLLWGMWDADAWRGVSRLDKELAELIEKCTAFEKEKRIRLGEVIERLKRMSLEPRRFPISQVRPRYESGWEEYDNNSLAQRAFAVLEYQSTEDFDNKGSQPFVPVRIMEESEDYRPLDDEDELTIQACLSYGISEIDVAVYAEGLPETQQTIFRIKMIDTERRKRMGPLGDWKGGGAKLLGMSGSDKHKTRRNRHEPLDTTADRMLLESKIECLKDFQHTDSFNGVDLLLARTEMLQKVDSGETTNMETYASEQLAEGIQYLNGTRSAENSEKAFACFRNSAYCDNVEAQYYVGLCLANGIGADVDLKEAEEWFTKAAEGGHREAYKEIIRQL